MTAVASAIALLFSVFSFWESSIKGPNIKVFVPPVIQYSSPYNNSNFEMIAVPVTLVNDGGRTGTVLSMELEVSNSKSKEPKHFYAADFGRWTMEKTRAGSYEPFAPMSLAGKASRTETVLFYTKSPAEKPEQLITEPGVYTVKLKLDEAPVNDWGPLDRLISHGPAELSFAMELRYFAARGVPRLRPERHAAGVCDDGALGKKRCRRGADVNVPKTNGPQPVSQMRP